MRFDLRSRFVREQGQSALRGVAGFPMYRALLRGTVAAACVADAHGAAARAAHGGASFALAAAEATDLVDVPFFHYDFDGMPLAGAGVAMLVVATRISSPFGARVHPAGRAVHASERGVVRGQRVGAVGSTGTATGPHLHFEVRRHDRLVDPIGLVQAARAAKLKGEQRVAFDRVARDARTQLASVP